MKTIKIIAFTLCVFVLLACSKPQSPYDKAVDYIDELSTEVRAATNDAEYDAAYKKIVNINANEVMTNLGSLPQAQKQEVMAKAENLILEALAVKAILYVMPRDISPSADDISKLTDECLQDKADVLVAPYPQVREIVRKYYKLGE